MKKFAMMIAATALMATPAWAQYAVGPHPYGGPYVRTSPYGGPYAYAPGPYALAEPYAQFNSGTYSRERDIATEPDPNVRLELRREEHLNEGGYNY